MHDDVTLSDQRKELYRYAQLLDRGHLPRDEGLRSARKAGDHICDAHAESAELVCADVSQRRCGHALVDRVRSARRNLVGVRVEAEGAFAGKVWSMGVAR